MIKIEGPGSELAKVESGSIAKPSSPITVGQLELALEKRFPRSDAESWDRMGLLVGDPAALVSGVLVALDPSGDVIAAAEKSSANVVLTHHPVFLEPPASFSPSYDVASASGVNVWNAAAHGVALMNFHTALDVSPEATRLLPRMLNLDFERLLAPFAQDARKGYGSVCAVNKADAPFKLEHLAARCLSVFGRPPRVWGDMRQRLERVVVANGAAGNVVEGCLKEHVDCLVCGELRYHSALDASQAGLSIVELGHDVSELPLVALLAQAAVDAGVEQTAVSAFDQSGNWVTPDSTRI